MKHKPYCLVSGVLLALVGTGHFLRIVYDIPLIIGDYAVPLTVTWCGVIGPGLLAIWAFRVLAATDKT